MNRVTHRSQRPAETQRFARVVAIGSAMTFTDDYLDSARESRPEPAGRRAGMNRVSSVSQPPSMAGTKPTRPPHTLSNVFVRVSPHLSRLVTRGCRPHSTNVCGALRARSKGVTGAGTGTARFDRLGESRIEKPCGDDSLVDGSTRGGATGRSRPRDETRPTDAGRDGPETCSVASRGCSCVGTPSYE